jgi:hypothetical protein
MFFQIMLATLAGLWVLLILAIIRSGYENMKWEHEKQERMKKAKRE